MPRRRQKAQLSAIKPGVVPNQPTFSGPELAAIAGTQSKTITLWRRRGLLPRVAFVGRSTRYDRAYARRVAAIARMGVQAAKHPRFAEMIPIILEETPRPNQPAPAPAAPKVAPSTEADQPFAAAAWQRLELIPGIEIHVADFVAPIMRGVVREIAKRFGRTL